MCGRVIARLATVIALTVPAFAGHAGAQAPGSEAAAAIDGAVVDASGRGIPDVDVVVLDSRQSVRTKGTGAFRLDSVETGPHVLRFRRLGMQPVTLTVVVTPNEVTGVDVVMAPWVHRLETVEVQAKTGDVLRVPKAFAERMRGVGTYLTEADILRRHPLYTGEIFRGIPGLSVSRDGKQVSSSRRGSIYPELHESSCPRMPVYLNGGGAVGTDVGGGTATMQGTPLNAAQNAPASPAVTSAGSLGVEAVAPQEIIGIEIYRGAAEMPATLPPSPCGAIVIWTK